MADKKSIDEFLAEIDSESDALLQPETQEATIDDALDPSASDNDATVTAPTAENAATSTDLPSADARPASPLSGPEPELPQSIDDTASAEQPEIPGITFTPKGTKSWNTREPYVIQIDPSALADDRIKINAMYYFINEPFENDSELKQRLHREILKLRRGRDDAIVESYNHFIHASLSDEIQKFAEYFKITDSTTLNLLAYHLGPLSLYRIVAARFAGMKVGHCFMLNENQNQTVKFMPSEYIKTEVLHWFEENIHSLDLPFDSIQEFERIKKTVYGYYLRVVEQFNNRHNELNKQLVGAKAITREELLRRKGAQWFGASNIIVYKRFIPRTIFQTG